MRRMSDEELINIAKVYPNRRSLRNARKAVYGNILERKLSKTAFSHMAYLTRPTYSFEELNKIASDMVSRKEFETKHPSAYKSACSKKIIDQICAHMEPQYESYTLKSLEEIAKKYSTRGSFAISEPNAHRAAHRLKFLDEICSHMDTIHADWSIENLLLESRKYNSRAEFKFNNVNAYMAACRKRILNQVCIHMKRSGCVSGAESEIMDLVKKIYSDSCTLRKTKLKIRNRPYIKRLDVDIYIPKLKIGIEYDGTYHHSFEGLKRSRKNWPIKAIKQYHKIKDDYFSSIGITILHIKEEDWMNDKNKCIQEITSFIKKYEF